MAKPVSLMKSLASAKLFYPRAQRGRTSRTLSSLSHCLIEFLLVELTFQGLQPESELGMQNVLFSLTLSCSFLIFMTLLGLLPLSLWRMWIPTALRFSCPLLLPPQRAIYMLKLSPSYVPISRVPPALRCTGSDFEMIYHCNLC